MICLDCRGGVHGACKGGTWCDCQHRTDVLLGVAEPPPFMTRCTQADCPGWQPLKVIEPPGS